MKYLKIILTIIAVLLAVHLFKPFIVSCTLAGGSWQDINIVAVGGKTISYDGSVPVSNK
jgi:hypothetical protein